MPTTTMKIRNDGGSFSYLSGCRWRTAARRRASSLHGSTSLTRPSSFDGHAVATMASAHGSSVTVEGQVTGSIRRVPSGLFPLRRALGAESVPDVRAPRVGALGEAGRARTRTRTGALLAGSECCGRGAWRAAQNTVGGVQRAGGTLLGSSITLRVSIFPHRTPEISTPVTLATTGRVAGGSSLQWTFHFHRRNWHLRGDANPHRLPRRQEGLSLDRSR